MFTRLSLNCRALRTKSSTATRKLLFLIIIIFIYSHSMISRPLNALIYKSNFLTISQIPAVGL